MKNGILRVTANVTGPVRRERLMGRDYRVVPARLVRSQVLNNNLGRTFLPAEDITSAWAAAANNAPVVVGSHPRTTAKDPKILNRTGAGFLFRTTVGNGSLDADVFLDEELLGSVPGGDAIIKRLDEGEPVGLSTGFPVAIEEQVGNHEGKKFDRIIHPAGFDHLAIFTDLKGACSIDDGCALGLNEDSAITELEEGEPDDDDDEDDVGNEAKGTVAKAIALLRRIVGAEPGGAPGSENRSANDVRRLLSDAISREHGSEDVHTFVEDFFEDEGLVVFEIMGAGDASGLFRSSFAIDEDEGAVELGEPERVRRVTSFEPAENAGDTSKGDSTMNRDELIARLAEEGPLDAESLAKLSDCQLQALAGTDAGSGDGEGDGDGDGDAGNTGGGGDPKPSEDASMALLRELSEKVDRQSKVIAELRETTKPVADERARTHASLVTELAANERCPFDEGELKAKTVEELVKLRSMARGESYVGLGGPRTGTVPDAEAFNEDDLYLEPKPYWENGASDAANGKPAGAATGSRDGGEG